MKGPHRTFVKLQVLFFVFIWSVLVTHGNAWLQRLPHDRQQHLQPIATTSGHVPCMTQDSLDEFDAKIQTLPRLYISSVFGGLGENAQVILTPDQAHYVTKVMRIGKKGSRDSVRIFDGVNGEWLAQIEIIPEENESSSKRKRQRRDDMVITARCIRQLREQPEDDSTGHPLVEPWLFFAPLKKPRVKFLLEKCTELGAGRFMPILTDRVDSGSIRDILENLDKLTAQTIEASEQCERLTVPFLFKTCISNDEDPWDVTTLLKEWSTQDIFLERHLLICRERSADVAVPVLTLLEQLSQNQTNSVAFLIGPEGGWSPAEDALYDHYTASCRNIHCISLGSLILRAETAAMTAVSACMLCQESQ